VGQANIKLRNGHYNGGYKKKSVLGLGELFISNEYD